MKFLLCVFLALWYSNVSAKSVQADECCMPETYEAVSMGVLHIHPNTMQQVTKISADFKKSRYAQNLTSYSETEVVYELLLVFMSKDIAYLVDLGAKTCSKSLGKFEIERCLPSEAKYIGSAKIGGVLDIDSYADPTGTNTLQVTQKDCLPVSQSAIDASADIYGGFSFYNVTSTIADESVFDIPSYCEEAQVVEDIHMLPAFRKFNSLFLNNLFSNK